jgi:hypothetical protein
VAQIPVFEDSGKLYGQIGINRLPLFQARSPGSFALSVEWKRGLDSELEVIESKRNPHAMSGRSP